MSISRLYLKMDSLTSETAHQATELFMRDEVFSFEPIQLSSITSESAAFGFRLASERRTGALLRVLAASKPGGRLLELGTGTGVGTAWLLSGMDDSATLDTVDNDQAVVSIAQRNLGSDSRVRFHVADGDAWLNGYSGRPFDLIFADAWPGKFSALSTTLSLLSIGGFYVIDDLLQQSNWPEQHALRIEPLLSEVERLLGFVSVRLAWASGLAIVVRQA